MVRRRVLNFLAVLSLLLGVALAGLWRSSHRPHLYGIGHRWSVVSLFGQPFECACKSNDGHVELEWRRRTQPLPGPRFADWQAFVAWRSQFPRDARYARFGFAAYAGPFILYANTGTSMEGSVRGIIVPYWLPVILLAILPARLLRRSIGAYRARRGRRFQREHAPGPGLCRRCGYDLRATPDRCPECDELTEPRRVIEIAKGDHVADSRGPDPVSQRIREGRSPRGQPSGERAP
jgi:hypothetical protein